MPERVSETLHEQSEGSMVLQCSTKRYKRGRKIMLISAALFALSRALYFLPSESRPDLPPAIGLLSAVIPIWVWVTCWVAVFLLCLRDLFRAKGRIGIGLLVGMMFAWGAAYLLNYAITVFSEGFGSSEWFNFATYAFAGGVIFGLVMKVGALKRRGEDE